MPDYFFCAHFSIQIQKIQNEMESKKNKENLKHKNTQTQANVCVFFFFVIQNII